MAEELTPEEEIKELFQALFILHFGLHPVTSSGALYKGFDGFATQAFTTHCLTPLKHKAKFQDEADAMDKVTDTIRKYTEKYPDLIPDMSFMEHYLSGPIPTAN